MPACGRGENYDTQKPLELANFAEGMLESNSNASLPTPARYAPCTDLIRIRRKVRCSGTLPCEYCTREDAVCTFSDNFTTEKTSREGGVEAPDRTQPTLRNSLETVQRPPIDQHIGPAAGFSFLYNSQNAQSQADSAENGQNQKPAHLTSYGDLSQGEKIPYLSSTLLQLSPSPESASTLLERYFRFATPTYRFFHRPTLESWSNQLLSGSSLTVSKSACVLLAYAQALLYTRSGDRYANGGDDELVSSRLYYQQAKVMLGKEPGPASLASVQSRLAICLYLLSTFNITECRFCFSFTIEISASIGLHRKTSTCRQMSLVEIESRKRTFWCAYVLDGYLSVLLGRPRLIRDVDVDQEFPRNFDDQDMESSDSPEDLPLHGNLEAFICHAELAKLMGRTNDRLYPLRTLSREEILERANQMMWNLDLWRDTLPGYLKPKEKTLTGQRSFERQNTVLKLALAHTRILATRRCVIADFNQFGKPIPCDTEDFMSLKAITECVEATVIIIGVANDLFQKKMFHQAFWFTQYTTLVAISTLYVFIIQMMRNGLTVPIDGFPRIPDYFNKAKQCQQHLAVLAPDGSQARRHQKLLDQLKARAEKEMEKLTKMHKLETGKRRQEAIDSPGSTHQHMGQQMDMKLNKMYPAGELRGKLRVSQSNGNSYGSAVIETVPSPITPGESGPGAPAPAVFPTSTPLPPIPTTTVIDPNEDLISALPFPPSSDDLTFENMLDFGWENIDTIGAQQLSPPEALR